MIRFTLSCANAHSFESWFKSNDACDTLMSKGMVSCTTCGSTTSRKTLMTPSVATKGHVAQAKSDPAPLEKLRREVEANAEYVGSSFAVKAREMHEGTAAEKSIYGEATPQEARSLIEDGVPVLPLPFIPTKKAH